jgi:hypothetical protein
MTQATLQFDPMLSRQQRLMYELFKRQSGYAMNIELRDVCLNYTARLSELRQKGYTIKVVEKRKHGVRVYKMEEGL